ncbi:MAG: hypothetical protein LUO85_05970 [Methanomassiliicoccales archaeon]|nr:hypothetical protein [Methanomassiliicoccales archaeon]
MKRDSSAAIGLLVVLIVALIVVAIVAVVVLVPWQKASVDENRSVAKTVGVKQMVVSVTANTGLIDVSFGDLGGDLAQLSVKGSGSLNLLTKKAPVVVNLTSTSSVDGMTLNVAANVNVDTVGSAFSFADLRIMMVLDRSVPSHVNAISQAGQISLTAGSGVVLQGVNLQATAGSVAMTLRQGVNLTGNVSMITTTGAVTLNWSDVTAKNGTRLTLGATTGAVDANITQHGDLGGNVTVSAIATTGAVHWTMNISGGSAAHIESASGFDSVNVQKNVGFTGANDNLSSTNFAGAHDHSFAVVLSVNTGSINLDLDYVA